LETAGWSVDALATRPAETGPGIFDDAPDHRRSLWGVYAARALPAKKSGIDIYYLGYSRKKAQFDQGAGRELRHSLGTRIHGTPANWDYNYELVYQFGDFGTRNIRAWTTASDTGYRFKEFPFCPRIGLRADIASGDGNPEDNRLGTFNALFPKGAYFSQADLLGPYNLMDVHPSVGLELTQKLSVSFDLDFFWRQSTHDGIYSVPGGLIYSGKGIESRYIGNHANVELEWQISRHLSWTGAYLHFFPGRFLEEAGLNRPVNFVGTWLSYRF
jgi:hypothetical protein